MLVGVKALKFQVTLLLRLKMGILLLIPIFAGLSALGTLAGEARAIAKKVINKKNAP